MAETDKVAKTLENSFTPDSLEHILGFRFSIDENHRITIRCLIQPKHLNLRRDVHGGVIAALADSATGFAFSVHEGKPVSSATIDLDIKFIKAARAGTLTARPLVLRRGNRIGFVECEIRDDDDNLIAKASGTFAILSGDASQVRP